MAAMKVGRVGMGLAFALAIGVGCDDDKSNATQVEPNLDERWADVHPPDSVDISVCVSILDDGAPSRVSECYDCCVANGYGIGSFINQSQCTCAETMLPDTNACATKTADSQECNNCCLAASYQWSDYLPGDSPSCTCDMKNDKTSCKNTVTRTEPASQCALCCLNHGFINAAYTALGEPECGCS